MGLIAFHIDFQQGHGADSGFVNVLTYGDTAAWPPEADGTGYSLTLINPLSHPDSNQPANWRSSRTLNGSPAASDATTFTGNPSTDADGDGLSARLEYGLGTSDTDPASGPGSLQWDTASGTARLLRALAADDAVPFLEASSDLTAWSTTWTLTRRERLSDGAETLHFTAPANSPARTFLRARVP